METMEGTGYGLGDSGDTGSRGLQEIGDTRGLGNVEGKLEVGVQPGLGVGASL